jgi:DNA-binding MarR family transcriptional regulator
MTTVALWPTILEAIAALGRQYAPEMDRVTAELGLGEWLGVLLPALIFDPEPISAARLRRRSPYTSARFYNERMSKAAEGGHLAPVEAVENEYRLTELGRQAAKRVFGAVYARLEMLQPAPQTELERLASILYRLVEACLAAPEPPGKWSIRLSRRIDPGDEAAVLVRIDQYISDLAGYRDDAHLAAWQSHGLEGHTWEAFAVVWHGEAATLDELAQKLARRGYTRDEYQQALEDLIQRGWVEVKAGKYQSTAAGQAVHQAVEDVTDSYFYSPWACLSQDEAEELRALLEHLRDAL